MSRNKFIVVSGCIIWLLIGAAFGLQQLSLVSLNLSFLAASFLLVWFFTVLTFSILDANLMVSPPKLLNYILGGMLLKMFLGLASIAIVAIYYKPHLVVYVTGFLISYFVLTGFEVYVLIGKLRAVSKKMENSTDR